MTQGDLAGAKLGLYQNFKVAGDLRVGYGVSFTRLIADREELQLRLFEQQAYQLLHVVDRERPQQRNKGAGHAVFTLRICGEDARHSVRLLSVAGAESMLCVFPFQLKKMPFRSIFCDFPRQLGVLK